jgi:hypothetical protein
MLSGFNTDCLYDGKVYHIQTEDHGSQNPYVVTLLYQGGAIIASKKTCYADILKADCLTAVVRDLMEEQHKAMLRDLRAGKFETLDPSKRHEIWSPDEATTKSLDELILDYLSREERTP